MAVKTSVLVFWIVTLRGFVGTYKHYCPEDQCQLIGASIHDFKM